MVKINVGDIAPDFSLLDQDNNKFTLSSLRGKKVVMFFYPKDFSPGCTKEACHFRDQYEDFTEEDAEVIGISNDSPESHRKFIQQYLLPFTLLSDKDDSVKKLYGVTGFLLPNRITFVIDKKGIVRHVFSSSIDMKAHVKESLKILKQID